MKVVRLSLKDNSFYSGNDWDIFFKHVANTKGYLDEVGWQNEDAFLFDASKIYERELVILSGLFQRYKIDLQHLLKLKTKNNQTWFEKNMHCFQSTESRECDEQALFQVSINDIGFWAKQDYDHFMFCLKKIVFVVNSKLICREILLHCDRRKINVLSLKRAASVFRRYRIAFDKLLPFFNRTQRKVFFSNKRGSGACLLLRNEMLICLANSCTFDTDCNAEKASGQV
jgi:hypothetical protein